MVIHDTECPYRNPVSLGNIKLHFKVSAQMCVMHNVPPVQQVFTHDVPQSHLPKKCLEGKVIM